MMSGVLDLIFPFGFPGYDGVRRYGPVGRFIFGLEHFDHAQKMATYVSGAHELHQFLAGEPAVDQEVIKSDFLNYGAFDHPDKVVHLALEVLFRPLRRAAVRIAILAVSGIHLPLRQTLRLGRLLTCLTVECEDHEGLHLSIHKQERQALIAKDTRMLDMGKDAAKEFTLEAGLRKVCVIRNEAAGILALDGVAARGDASQKPAVEVVYYLLPVDILVGKEPVEHILLSGEHLTEYTSGEAPAVFNGEERGQNHQLKDMAGREFAVRSLGKVHLPVGKRDVRLFVHDSLDRLRIVFSAEKMLSSEILCLSLFMLRSAILVCPEIPIS